MSHEVFISYSKHDRHVAEQVCSALEGEGLQCWIAPRDILPGHDWPRSIIEGITGARAMVLIFSSNANASPQVLREVERSVNKGIPVITVRIEEVEPTGSFEYLISTSHWWDAISSIESRLPELATKIHSLLADKRVSPNVCSTASRPTQFRRRWKTWHKRVAIGIIGLTAVAVLSLLVNRTFSVARRAEARTRQAGELMFLGHYKEAVDELGKAVETDPTYIPALLARAEAFLELSEYESAIADCDKIIAILPTTALAYAWRGIAKTWIGDTETAIDDCSVALQHEPNSAIGLACRSLAFLEKYDLENALEDGKDAVEADPNLAWAEVARCLSLCMVWDTTEAEKSAGEAVRKNAQGGHAYVARSFAKLYNGKHEESLANTEEAIHRLPNNDAAFIVQSQAYLMKGRYDDALRAANDAVRIEPRRALGYVARAWTQIMLNNTEKALENVKEALARNPRCHEAYFVSALCAFTLERFDEVAINADKAIDTNKQSPYGYISRGLARLGQNRFQEAIADFDTANNIMPSLGLGYVGLGMAYALSNQSDKALLELDEGLKRTPTCDAYTVRARIRNLRKDIAGARADIEAALRLNPASPDAHAVLVELAYDEKDWRALIDHASLALNHPTLSVREMMYYDRGRAYQELSMYDEAISDFSEALEIKPDDEVNSFSRGFTYYSRGDYALAIDDLSRAIRLDPKDATNYFWRGKAFARLQKHDEAIRDYDDALRIDNKNAAALGARGTSYSQLGKHDDALKDLQAAIQIDKSSCDLRSLLGDAYASAGRLEEAIRTFGEQIAIEPDDHSGYISRSLSILKLLNTRREFDNQRLIQLAQAESDLRRLLELDTKGERQEAIANGFTWIASLIVAHGDLARGLTIVDEVINRWSSFSAARMLRATIHQSQKSFEQARDDLNAIRDLEPGFPGLWNAYTNLDIATGQLERAATSANTAVENNPKDDRAYYLRAQLKVTVGRHLEAIEDLNQALSLSPEDTTYLNMRGSTYEVLGKAEEAYKDYTSAIKREPVNPQHWAVRVALLMSQKDYQAALKDLEKAIELAPQVPPIVFFYKAMAFYQMGNLERYRQEMDHFDKLEVTAGFSKMRPVVQSIPEGSKAERLGIRVGDILLFYDGHVLHHGYQVQLLSNLAGPSVATLEVLRGGKTEKFSVPAGVLGIVLVDQIQGEAPSSVP